MGIKEVKAGKATWLECWCDRCNRWMPMILGLPASGRIHNGKVYHHKCWAEEVKTKTAGGTKVS